MQFILSLSPLPYFLLQMAHKLPSTFHLPSGPSHFFDRCSLWKLTIRDVIVSPFLLLASLLPVEPGVVLPGLPGRSRLLWLLVDLVFTGVAAATELDIEGDEDGRGLYQ